MELGARDSDNGTRSSGFDSDNGNRSSGFGQLNSEIGHREVASLGP